MRTLAKRLTVVAALHIVFLFSACTKPPDKQTLTVKEPQAYRATITYSYLPNNNRGLKPNELFTLDVARNGADRQYGFNFGGRRLSYLEGPQRQYLISNGCQEYTDTTLEAMNFRIPGSLAPEQLIAGLAREARDTIYLGEEQFNGRLAMKYSTPDETLIYVDKATGLPLRTEIEAEVAAPSKGRTSIEDKGTLSVIIELHNIRTDIDPNTFKPPENMKEVEQSAMCGEVSQLAESAMQLLWTLSNKRSDATPTR